MNNQRGRPVFRTLDDIAMELQQETKFSTQVTQVQWKSPKQEWSGARPANEDPWASQVARYLQLRAAAGTLLSTASQRAVARGE